MDAEKDKVTKMKQTTACFTGHRNLPTELQSRILRKTADAVVQLYNQGYRTFCTGGALGFDTLAARVVVALRKTHPDMRLHLVLPCPEQAARWSQDDKCRYEAIKTVADEVTYTCEQYTPYCMHARNRQLVELSSACVCYLTNNKGGTAYTVDYAKKKGLTIVSVAD